MATAPGRKTAPETKVHFDLEVAEQELLESEEIEPFTVKVGERTITMIDARTLDWTELYDLNHPAALVQKCVEKRDWAYFLAQKISGRALNLLFEAYREHYGIRKPLGQ